MKFKSYPKYKSSGVEWLGDVPEHWATKAIKWITPVLRGASPRPIDDPAYFDEEGEYAWVRIADVTASKVYLEETTQKLSEVGSALSVKLKPGALFLSIAATVGVPCITKIKCCIHDGFVYFSRLKANTKYMYYIFVCGESYKGLGKLGTQLNLNTDTVGSIVIGVPSLNEQQAIADFLDRETGRLEELIAKKEQLIERLKEKRTAMISRAVTKGLNPNVHPKPSGVAWLGDVPEHWTIRKLKYFVKAITGFAFSSDDYVEEGISLIRIGDILESGIVDTENAKKLPEEFLRDYRFCQINNRDILVAMTGATIGKAGRYCDSSPGLLNQRVCMFRSAVINHEYLGYLLKTPQYFEHIKLTGFGGAEPNISDSQMLDFIALLPPIAEQEAIVEYLDRETGKIDALSEKVREAIEKLKEYRTALISAAVTGKVDVRGHG